MRSRIAIAALAELNKMEHNEKLLQHSTTGNQPIEIVINNQTLPRGPLDG